MINLVGWIEFLCTHRLRSRVTFRSAVNAKLVVRCLSVMRRKAKGAIDVVLGVCVFVAGLLGIILFLDFVGLSIYFVLQDWNWNFHTLSWVLLAEGFILMGIGASILFGGEKRNKRVSYMDGQRYGPVITKLRRLSLHEEELALVLFFIGICLFILGLIFF